MTLAPGQSLRIAAGDDPGTRGCVFTPYRAADPVGEAAAIDCCWTTGASSCGWRSGADDELVTVGGGNGGSLGQHKGINAPGVALPASALTEKDAADLRFGLQLGVDLVALSFVQTADDVQRARRQSCASAGRSVPMIAKIERPAAVENLDAILEVAQGVMVARGDLGLEMPLEQVPRVQKHIIRRARAAGLRRSSRRRCSSRCAWSRGRPGPR